MSEPVFNTLRKDDLGLLKQTLDDASLPTDNLEKPGRSFFGLACEAGPIGFVGIEGQGADRLLRSLVVAPSHQRRGHGASLLTHAEAAARREGATRLHLPTTGASEFFQRWGYRLTDRAAVPASIATTDQFASLCPDSAAYLVKELS